jgi:hypothetical protein
LKSRIISFPRTSSVFPRTLKRDNDDGCTNGRTIYD